MAYEKITCGRKYRKYGPTVTVLGCNKFRFNSAAVRQWQERQAEYAALLWDQSERKIAFKIAPRSDRSASKLSFSRTPNSVADLGARLFLRSLGRTEKHKAVDIPLTWDEKEQMFEGVVPELLSEPVEDNHHKNKQR